MVATLDWPALWGFTTCTQKRMGVGYRSCSSKSFEWTGCKKTNNERIGQLQIGIFPISRICFLAHWWMNCWSLSAHHPLVNFASDWNSDWKLQHVSLEVMEKIIPIYQFYWWQIWRGNIHLEVANNLMGTAISTPRHHVFGWFGIRPSNASCSRKASFRGVQRWFSCSSVLLLLI